jgi:hypothetical protein
MAPPRHKNNCQLTFIACAALLSPLASSSIAFSAAQRIPVGFSNCFQIHIADQLLFILFMMPPNQKIQIFFLFSKTPFLSSYCRPS